MVNPIYNLNLADIKARENKTSSRDADIRQNPSIEDRADYSYEETASPAVNVTISKANAEAAEFACLNQEQADEMLRETTDLMRQLPDLAESAQASLPSQIVLNLFEIR